MIEFSENGKLCLDSRLKRGLDLIANGSVTLDIWKFKLFVFLTNIQSYAPLPFNAFDLIANGSVTLDIWKFKMFVF